MKFPKITKDDFTVGIIYVIILFLFSIYLSSFRELLLIKKERCKLIDWGYQLKTRAVIKRKENGDFFLVFQVKKAQENCKPEIFEFFKNMKQKGYQVLYSNNGDKDTYTIKINPNSDF